MYRVKVRHCKRRYGFWGAVTTVMFVVTLNASCFDTETTLCEMFGGRCAPGFVCARYQAACVPIGGCGDGVVSSDEVCDDGNIENGDDCNATCTTGLYCGNGFVDVEEECDPGIRESPGCDSDCTFVRCGDYHVNAAAGEECDTGNSNPNSSACNGSSCKLSRCGDSYFNPSAGEECDTGGETQACDDDCTRPVCGDGHFNPLAELCERGPPQSGCSGGAVCKNDCSACL